MVIRNSALFPLFASPGAGVAPFTWSAGVDGGAATEDEDEDGGGLGDEAAVVVAILNSCFFSKNRGFR